MTCVFESSQFQEQVVAVKFFLSLLLASPMDAVHPSRVILTTVPLPVRSQVPEAP